MRREMPDMEQTKEHILAAGRELLLAADGALRFCKAYAETASAPSSRSTLVSFFSKAISVADELGKDLVKATGISKVAKSAVSPLFDALGREIEEAERMERSKRASAEGAYKKAKAGKAPPKKHRPASRRKASRHTVASRP
jgi:hypothetical protein